MSLISTRRRLAAGATAAGLSLVAACATAEPESPATGEPAIFATTSIWADITANVACGAPVRPVIPAGSDPHTFEPSLADRAALDEAALVVVNGAGFEEPLIDVLDTITANGVTVIEMTTHIDVLATTTNDTESADDGHGHDLAESGDPHVWQDPARIAGAVGAIADGLVAAGFDAAEIAGCAAAYRAELETLDVEIRDNLAVIPTERRVLVTNHDSLAYFADRYGFTIVGTVIPSTSTVAETDAATLAELSDAIAEHDVPAIFSGSLESSVDADALAERLGVEIVAIPTDSLTDDGVAATYIGLMRSNATAIAAALRAD